jgi:uncharacterized protein (DUF1778 family)
MKNLPRSIFYQDSTLNVLEPVISEEANTLLDRHVFLLDDIQWKLFMDMLDAPIQPSEALHTLLTTKAPWEKENKCESVRP